MKNSSNSNNNSNNNYDSTKNNNSPRRLRIFGSLATIHGPLDQSQTHKARSTESRHWLKSPRSEAEDRGPTGVGIVWRASIAPTILSLLFGRIGLELFACYCRQVKLMSMLPVVRTTFPRLAGRYNLDAWLPRLFWVWVLKINGGCSVKYSISLAGHSRQQTLRSVPNLEARRTAHREGCFILCTALVGNDGRL